MLFTLLFLFLFYPLTVSLPDDTPIQYFAGLKLALISSGLSGFASALDVVNSTSSGATLLRGLTSNASFTIYAPVDSVSLSCVKEDVDTL